ncbi:MAG TPA: hypothetical protein VMX13_16310 [Sedimentisphaerales bacterium]|nr:hypothetical protein [Sedimentisphaerales bacterium]
MRGIWNFAPVFFLALVLVGTGCEHPGGQSVPAGDRNSELFSLYKPYGAAKLDITPLTGFVVGGERVSRIKAYVSLVDSFDCQIKSPGTFRFELYERVEASSERKGGRIAIWPDVDLTEVGENSGYWRDFLRAYEFNLDFEPQRNRRYILQVTCLCPTGVRLTGDFAIEYSP